MANVGVITGLFMLALGVEQPVDITVVSMAPDFVNKICLERVTKDPKADYSHGVAGCAMLKSDHTCLILLRNDLGEHYEYVRAHEEKHCRGWPSDHPENWNG